MSMNEKSGLEAVRKFLEGNGEREGLSAEMLEHGVAEVEDPEHPDCVVFEVRRERIIHDSFPRRAISTAIIVTNSARYAFNPAAKTLERLTKQSAPTIAADWDAVVENDINDLFFSCRLLGKGHHIFKVCGLVKEKWRTINFETVEEHIIRMSQDLTFEDTGVEIVARAGAGDVMKIREKLRDAFCNRAVAKARAKWVEYMENPVENSEEGD